MSKEAERTSTFCRICGRLLTVPESVERGIGPVCWGRHFEAEQEAEQDRLRGEAQDEAEAREQDEIAREEEQERGHRSMGPEGEPEA